MGSNGIRIASMNCRGLGDKNKRKRKSTTLRINNSLLPNGGKNTDLYLIIELIFV